MFLVAHSEQMGMFYTDPVNIISMRKKNTICISENQME
jgi:hypothetical protein